MRNAIAAAGRNPQAQVNVSGGAEQLRRLTRMSTAPVAAPSIGLNR